MSDKEKNYEEGAPFARETTGYLDSYDDRKLDPTDRADFASKILSFVRTNKTAADALVAGNIQMLGFDSLKERFGDQWEAMRAKVHLLSESVIKKLVAPEDVFVLLPNDQYIVLFGNSDHAKAAVVAKKIVEEVSAKLAGAGAGADAVSVRALVLEVPTTGDKPLQTIEGLGETVEETQRKAEEADAAAVVDAQDKLAMRYWPVANVKKKLVSAYQCELHVPAEHDLDLDLEQGSETGAMEAAIDGMTMELAGKALQEAYEKNWRAFMVVPVHSETLSVKVFREKYIEVCKELPEVSSKRLLLLVKGLPDDVPQGRIHTLFGYVGAFVAGFVGHFSLEFDRAEQLLGARMLGISAAGDAINQPSEEDVLALRKFIKSNEKAKLRGFFQGVRQPEAGMTARKCGFEYVQGPGVAPSMPMAGKVFKV